MPGTKKSGRRGRSYDRMNIQDVLKKSIWVIHKYLNDPHITLQNKAEIASRFAVKAIPERVLFDEVKKLSFEERMKLIHEFNKMMEARAERLDGAVRADEPMPTELLGQSPAEAENPRSEDIVIPAEETAEGDIVANAPKEEDNGPEDP